MQFDAEVFPYQRVKKAGKDEKNKNELNMYKVIQGISYFTLGILISRVMLINLMAPFGLAFLIAVCLKEEDKISVITACGVLIGYITLNGNMNNLPAYIASTGAVIGISYILKSKGYIIKLVSVFISIFIIMAINKISSSSIEIYICIITSLFEALSIFPIFYIIENSIRAFKDISTRHLFRNEEIMCMAVTASLAIAGTWGVSIHGITFRNIAALSFILIIGYIKGSTSGAAAGVAMGMILGITSSSMTAYVGFFGLCGMLSGVFREGGKWISGITFLLTFGIIKMYSNMGTELSIMECLLSCLIFYVIPGRVFYWFELELDFGKKQDTLRDNYTIKVKDILLSKLENFSDVLFNMSDVLDRLVDNDKLAMKGKSCALVENLGDRVCSTCNMKSICWKREYYNTYSAFYEMLQNFQEKKNIVPEELDRKCVKRTALVKSAEDIVNSFIMNEMWNKRLSESREVLAGQIGSIAESIKVIAEDFDCEINFNNTAEDCIRRALNKSSIKFRDILCYNNKNGRLTIKLDMIHCGGKQLCIKAVLPIINQVTGKCMCACDEGCIVDAESKSCSILFQETPKYLVATCAKGFCKDGEKYSGDSYLSAKLDGGNYMTILSDGMGSGPDARKESSAAVELLHKFSKSGFDKIKAINMVNSIMSIKFSESEKFSTVDINNIDLYTGEVDFIKVGAAASFIKSNHEVIPIKSRTLPMGVLDKVDIDVYRNKVRNGDFIVMLSDGILDSDGDISGRADWLTDFLKNNDYNSPSDLCDGIITKAKELGGGKVRDDMTVIVEKVYNLY
ncbi:MAG: stage II sporulation protein E [Solirubrobacterales bacterium]